MGRKQGKQEKDKSRQESAASTAMAMATSPETPLPDGSRFMETFQDMARKAVETSDESVIRMTEDGFLLIVSHKEGGDFSCQAMDKEDQGVFMERLHASAGFDPPLKPPYSVRDVELYEHDHSVKIPHLLRHYMTRVSCETCCDPVRMVIDIAAPPTVKVFVSTDGNVGRKECVTLQFTDTKLALLDSDMEGLIVTMDNETQGAFNPLWMSIFFPDHASSLRGSTQPATTKSDAPIPPAVVVDE